MDTIEDIVKSVTEQMRLQHESKEAQKVLSKPIEINLNDPNQSNWLQKRLKVAEDIINNSTEGNLHEARIKASRLIGGLVGGGYINEPDALSYLEVWTSYKTKKPYLAAKDVRDGLRNGMKTPIYYVANITTNINGNEFVPTTTIAPKLDQLKWNIYSPSRSLVPPDPEILIKFCDIPVLSRGNIMLLSSLAGYTKTNLLASIWSATIGGFNSTKGLGYTCPEGISSLFIDTEMSENHSFITWDRALRRYSVIDGDGPENLKWQNIRGIEKFSDRLDYLWDLLENNPPDLIVLDGIGDFLIDVNEGKETTALIANLCTMVHNKNIGMVISLHCNPPSKAADFNKARGHLGSELWRKAESAHTIIKSTEGVYTVTTDFPMGKNRAGRNDMKFNYTWDQEEQMHVGCFGGSDDLAVVDPAIKDQNKILKAMSDNDEYEHEELVNVAMKVTEKGRRTVCNRISEMIKNNFIRKNTNGNYSKALNG